MKKRLNHMLSALPAVLTARHPSGWRWAYAFALGMALFLAMPNPAPQASVAVAVNPAPANDPAQLAAADTVQYRLIFAAQDAGDFAAADAHIAQLTNHALLGHVLAERYLDPRYHASAAQLDQWLDRYRDHPGAARIAKLANGRGLQLARSANALKGSGYIDHLGRSTMPDRWYEALSHWREADYDAAAPMFLAVADDASLSDWQRAAGYYWAYRASDRAGESRAAHRALAHAAEFPTTFYGLLANRAFGTPDLHASAPKVAENVRRNPHAQRAALLARLTKNDAAEAELRLLYAQVPDKLRPGIITLASELNLPNLQVRLARLPGLSASESLFAQYPMPGFMVDAQHAVDPSLLLAIARNESGFRADVGSSAGARGMMQMLPATARAVERKIGLASLQLASNESLSVVERLADPETSVRYGAEYIKLLSAEPAIRGNLVRLLAGYNAGPGAVASWQRAAAQVDDPLLYIESIPYAETRNYVMQVMAQYWIYQVLRGEQPASLAAMAQGSWPQV
ncbi:MAG: lytic transglycosylase domain-containing protein [Rickettsiales bacterium]